ncbi:hypothetical protein ACFL13_00700 [Patescibacteria group bacterium]
MRRFWFIVILSFAIYFLSWAVVYLSGLNSLPIQSEDTLPTVFLPVTIIKEKTIYADTYYKMIRDRYPHPDDKDFQKDLTPFYFQKVGVHYISAFPLITGFLALPIYFFPIIFGLSITWVNLIILSKISSALIAAAGGGVLYLLLKKHFKVSEKKAMLLTGVYLFGSINFALISQALWQHGTMQLMILLALWFLYERKWFLTGIFCILALLSRPPAIAFLPFFGLLVLLQKETFKDLVNFGLGLVPPILFFVWYTSTYYLGIENNGYAGQFLTGWLSRFPEGFLGLWISPSKGILVYSPIFVFSLIGAYLAVRNRGWRLRENFIYVISLCIVVLHTMILGKWKHWYGGWGFGYRMAADIIPFLVILLVPFIRSEFFEKYKNWFFGLLIFSVLVQVFGMIFFDGIWHAAYDLGFENTSWLWSIRDSEFIFNIRRVLVKLGYLSRACPKCL